MLKVKGLGSFRPSVSVGVGSRRCRINQGTNQACSNLVYYKHSLCVYLLVDSLTPENV